MYLKSVELIGFKSFVDRTKLEFLPGIGAIVGPNGCGKSNISDALRWVLGEQSAKALRGSEMTDVIFNGTDQRKPIGMAEVTLTLGDCEKELGIAYHEINITRRVYRDGTGEYFLNKTPCRLKDIQQLFMDTGIGRASYWLMEQGKIERILSARPEDRRAIFEEAAGITKYKAQRHEAMNKLELTNRNLEQLEPLLKEIKRQIISLQRQAGKARRYKEISAELKTLETRLARHRYDELHLEITNLQSQVDALQSQLQEFTCALEAEEAALAESRAAEQAVERQISELEQRRLALESDIKRNEDHIRYNHNRIAELTADSKQKSADLGGMDEKIRAQDHFLQKASEEWERQNKVCAEAERGYQTQLAAAKATDEALVQAENELAQWNATALEVQQRLSQMRNQKVELEQKRLLDTRKVERLAAEQSTLEERATQAEKKVQAFQEALAPLETAAARARTEFQSSETAIHEQIMSAQNGDAKALASLPAVLQAATEAREKWFSTEILWAEKRGESRWVQNELRECRERLEAVQWELQTLSAQGDSARRIEELEKLLAELGKREADATGQLRAARRLCEQRAAEKAAKHEKLGEAKLAWLSAQSARDAARERREAATARAAELREQQQRWQAEIARDRDRITVLLQEIEQFKAAVDASRDKIQTLEGEISEKRAQRQAVEAAIAQRESALRQKRQAIADLQQQRHIVELRAAEKNKDIENLSRSLMERYQVDVTSLLPESSGNEDWMTLQDKADELKIRLQEMGPVNAEAIQEYDELEKRHAEITQQQQDLQKGKENLKEAIAKINATAKQLFQETFDKINANFQEMFAELFGGGRASLRLLEAQEGGEDALESGIEILARPPGKHLQTVALLSGGEKALTAIALLFAIYQVKPAPFCLFDELDAPLDESNVGRFCKVLQRFVSQSQLIVVTHNKRTMAMADVLYGVTMEESGVSKIVSIEFKDPNALKSAPLPEPTQTAAAATP